MKKRQEMRKRCQALVLAGILGAGTLGSAYTAGRNAGVCWSVCCRRPGSNRRIRRNRQCAFCLQHF